jgi:hypothetical protein
MSFQKFLLLWLFRTGLAATVPHMALRYPRLDFSLVLKHFALGIITIRG